MDGLIAWLIGWLIRYGVLTTETLQPTSRDHNVTVLAGSVVNLECKLNVNCSNRTIKWEHYEPSANYPEYWYNGNIISPSKEWRNATVEDNTESGRSVLTIPSVRLSDRGRFVCHVTGLKQCRWNFSLIVYSTGNYFCIIIWIIICSFF